MPRNDSWLLATALALAAPSVFAGQPPQRDDPPSAAAATPQSRTQSPIGRALAGLLQQAPAESAHQPSARTAEPPGSIATTSDEAGVSSRRMHHVDTDDARDDAHAEPVAVH
jgi:hypothetical protein